MAKKKKGGKKTKGKKHRGTLDDTLVQLTDSEFKLFILALQVESKRQAVAFYQNWSKDQSLDLKILNQKANLTRKRHNNHLRNLTARGELFENSYGPYVYIPPILPNFPGQSSNKQPASGGGSNAIAPDTKPKSGHANSMTTGSNGPAPDSGKQRQPSTSTLPPPSAPRAATNNPLKAAVNTVVNGNRVFPAVSAKDGKDRRQSTFVTELQQLEASDKDGSVPSGPAPIPIPIPGVKRYDGTSMAASMVPKIPMPDLELDEAVAAKRAEIKHLNEQREGLERRLRVADAEVTEFRRRTDPALLEQVKTTISRTKQKIEELAGESVRHATTAEERHKDALIHNEEATVTEIQNVNQQATEAEIRNMSTHHRAIVDRNKRLKRELASVRGQEDKLQAIIDQLHSQFNQLIREANALEHSSVLDHGHEEDIAKLLAEDPTFMTSLRAAGIMPSVKRVHPADLAIEPQEPESGVQITVTTEDGAPSSSTTAAATTVTTPKRPPAKSVRTLPALALSPVDRKRILSQLKDQIYADPTKKMLESKPLPAMHDHFLVQPQRQPTPSAYNPFESSDNPTGPATMAHMLDPAMASMDRRRRRSAIMRDSGGNAVDDSVGASSAQLFGVLLNNGNIVVARKRTPAVKPPPSAPDDESAAMLEGVSSHSINDLKDMFKGL